MAFDPLLILAIAIFIGTIGTAGWQTIQYIRHHIRRRRLRDLNPKPWEHRE